MLTMETMFLAGVLESPAAALVFLRSTPGSAQQPPPPQPAPGRAADPRARSLAQAFEACCQGFGAASTLVEKLQQLDQLLALQADAQAGGAPQSVGREMEAARARFQQEVDAVSAQLTESEPPPEQTAAAAAAVSRS
eukprot:COSAG01_NODE_2799_length_7053_cov_21.482456_6_plen_137_part_00